MYGTEENIQITGSNAHLQMFDMKAVDYRLNPSRTFVWCDSNDTNRYVVSTEPSALAI